MSVEGAAIINRTISTATAFLPPPSPRTTGLFTADEYAQMRAFFARHPELAPTPLRRLPALARDLHIGTLLAKDESARFGLNAFKLLGARFAIETLVRDGDVRPGATLVCASEGNHGRAVARAARDAGCGCRVYMAHDVASSRVDAIAGEGAEVIKVDGSYDDAVRIMEADATRHHWTIISDTAWPGYERIPRLIMLGYTHMLDEVREPGAGNREPEFDAIFVQGGVGGLLCAMASWCAFHRRENPPRVIAVEPTSAACLQASARARQPVAVTGPLNTAMAGLRNREVSPPAFMALLPIVDAFMAIDDVWSDAAMLAFGKPHDGDPVIEAGASGSAALGGLLALCREPSLVTARDALGITEQSRILVIVSEGVTDPQLWRTKMG
ncbi:MAG TPA: diaminopropionate ammonia-lyase [Vicinamibacterales bacterium]|nr:diaminopropionate ammonia-lyase [Vicinamibacterales bacterium]